MLKNFLSLVLFVFSFLASAQNLTEKTLLWKVSGNGLDKASYVFGTYHMMCKDDFQVKEKVTKALSETQNYVMEINFADPVQMAELQKPSTDAKKVGDVLSKEQIDIFKENLPKIGLTYEMAAGMDLLAFNSMVMIKLFPCEMTDLRMLDLDLMMKAMANKMTLNGLETAKQQKEILGSFLTPKDMVKVVADLEGNKTKSMLLTKTYLAEDLQELDKMMKDPKEITKEQERILLSDRNIDWVAKMPTIMKEKPTFFAVGAGHLSGNEGVLNLLKEKGYTVTPIF